MTEIHSWKDSQTIANAEQRQSKSRHAQVEREAGERMRAAAMTAHMDSEGMPDLSSLPGSTMRERSGQRSHRHRYATISWTASIATSCSFQL